MADEESVACEEEETSLTLKEADSEEEMQEISVEAAEIQDASDKKRKLNDLAILEEDKAPAKKHQICESALVADQGTAETDEVARVIEVEEIDGSGHPTTLEPNKVDDGTASDSALGGTTVQVNVEEHLDQDGEIGEAGLEELEKESSGNEQISSINNIQHVFVDNAPNPSLTLQDDLPQAIHQTPYDLSSSSRKIEVPNNKVGIIIGKSGETIRFLQINSGARIQITRDADVGPLTSTRPVELTGTLENINKAEQLIKNVIAEADAGGSPSLVARGFSTSQPGSEQTEIQVPNGKVGVIIGKGGETIKNLQTKTGARIQLIPQHLPEGDSSSERTVRITGNKKQVEYAKEMIKDVMNQPPTRPSSHSNTFRPPRGPSPVTQWGPPHPTAPTQQTAGYGHPPIGYTPPTTQYPQTYGGYSQQPPARGTYGSSWDQHRPPAASQQPGGYDYYNQGGHVSNNQPPNTLPGPVPASAPAPVNYNNYAQQQSSDVYGNSQNKYGHGYNEPKYDNQPPGQHIYGQHHSVGSQPGMYGQQSSAPYSKPAYGEAPPLYNQARPSQPGEPMYQGAPPMQQPYPYASSAPTQPATYSQAYAPADGYSQQSSTGYPQQPAPVYGGQSVPQSSGYNQYPSSQPSYDQTAQTNPNYGYQGAAAPDAGYAQNVSNSGYAAQQPVGNQLGYAQPATNPSGYYDQSMPPPSGYGVVPGAPVGYSKSASPQPGYGGQYDSAQIYGQQ